MGEGDKGREERGVGRGERGGRRGETRETCKKRGVESDERAEGWCTAVLGGVHPMDLLRCLLPLGSSVGMGIGRVGVMTFGRDEKREGSRR